MGLKELRHDILSRFLRRVKIALNVRETTKYQFGKIEKLQNGKNKPKRNEDGQGWRRLTRIANDQLEKFRLNFSRCTNRDVVPLIKKRV